MFADKESRYLGVIEEWKTACDLLSTSLQRYLNACLALEVVCFDPCHTFAQGPPGVQGVDSVENELARFTRYHTKLDQAQVAMSLVRNRSPKLVPINVLPQEILSHIFHLVIIFECYVFSIPQDQDIKGTGITRFVDFPGVMSRVCAYWRRLILDTPVLWSYIDLVVSGPYKNIFYTRASCFVKRAAGAPLHICIHEPTSVTTSHDIEHLTNWLAPVFGQIYSFDVSEGLLAPGILRSVIGGWLGHGRPRAMKELTLQCGPDDRTHFIEPATELGPGPWRFDISPQQLEDFVQSISMLRLQGILLHWDSQAYVGLLHLRLDTGSITEWQLRQVLSNNPQLHTLAFGLNVTETAPRDVLQTPINLPDLAILNLGTMDVTHAWAVLRMLIPDPRSLRMSLAINSDNQCLSDFTEMEEAKAFLRRSNVTMLYLEGDIQRAGVRSSVWPAKALRELPHLRALCLERHSYLDGYLPCDLDGNQSNSGRSNLCELTVIQCELDLDMLKELFYIHPVHFLRLYDCTLFSNGNNLRLSAEELEAELSKSVPNTKCYDYEPGHADLCANWGFLNF